MSAGRSILSDPETASDALRAGLVVFAAYHLGLALVMALFPHAFFTTIGPFDAYNSHYIRDTATFEAALGFGFLVAIRRPGWRVPVLAITTVQFGLHAINHLFDAHIASPPGTGWFDFASLALATVALAWLWRRAAHEAAARPGRRGRVRATQLASTRAGAGDTR